MRSELLMEKYRQFSKINYVMSQTFTANLKKINAHRLSAGEEANEKLLYGLKHYYSHSKYFSFNF